MKVSPICRQNLERLRISAGTSGWTRESMQEQPDTHKDFSYGSKVPCLYYLLIIFRLCVGKKLLRCRHCYCFSSRLLHWWLVIKFQILMESRISISDEERKHHTLARQGDVEWPWFLVGQMKSPTVTDNFSIDRLIIRNRTTDWLSYALNESILRHAFSCKMAKIGHFGRTLLIGHELEK